MTALTKFLLVFVLVCSASPTMGQEKITFPVAASTKTAGYSPLWAGVRQGFFAQQGLDVQPIVIRGSDRSIQALIGGSVYAALLAPDAPMIAADRGLDAAIIAGNTQRLAHWILGGKNYKTFDDLRGATVGTISLTAGIGLVLRHVLKAKGLEYRATTSCLSSAARRSFLPRSLPIRSRLRRWHCRTISPPRSWAIMRSAASWKCSRIIN